MKLIDMSNSTEVTLIEWVVLPAKEEDDDCIRERDTVFGLVYSENGFIKTVHHSHLRIKMEKKG